MHTHEDHPHTIARNARIGLVLFTVYVALYAGFVLIGTLRPQWMGEPAPGGVNVAIAYGLGLIAAALVLALVYAGLCRKGSGRGTESAESEPS